MPTEHVVEPIVHVTDDTAVTPGLWPATARRDRSGELSVGGVAVRQLVADYGTPLYLLDEADVRARAIRVREAFAHAAAEFGTSATGYYAGKAFLCGALVNWVTSCGLGVDVCTAGELRIALAAGADPARIGLHGNNKSVAEIALAVTAGVGTIVIDHPDEVEVIAEQAARAGRVQAVRLRVNSGVHASTHEFLATAHEDQKFGVPVADAARIVANIRMAPSLSFRGLHGHIGSQIFGAAGFVEAAGRLVALHAELAREHPVPELNLGGGFGIAYTADDRPDPIEDTARAIVRAVADACLTHRTPLPALVFEPGRYIVGPAGIALYTVGTVKPVPIDGGSRTYVSVDGGMSDNPRPMLYGARYQAMLANRVSDAAPTLARIVGKHCEAGDVLIDASLLPLDVCRGDLLAVAATGAYCYSLASNYNALPRPGVVAVRDGQASELIRRETDADLLARDRFIAHRRMEGSA